MDSLPTLPRRTWLERASLASATLCALIGAAGLSESWLHLSEILPWGLAESLATRRDESTGLLVFGIALLLREFGWRAALWAAVVPAAIGLRGLSAAIEHRDFGFGGVFARLGDTAPVSSPAHLAGVTACCFLIGSGKLLWNAIDRAPRTRLFGTAFAGSLIASVGFSTWFGYIAELPAIYRWGATTAMPPLTALAFLFLGLSLLSMAWREENLRAGGPPAWSPMPAAIASLTLTLVLWLGLREREFSYLGQKTQTAMDQLATTIRFELELQTTAIERTARAWGETSVATDVAWDNEAGAHLAGARALGNTSLAFLDRDFNPRRLYPRTGTESAIPLDHLADPARREALDQASRNPGPVLSASTTVRLNDRLAPGFVIYSRSTRAGVTTGYLAADYVYRIFFQNLIATRVKIADEYHIRISIGLDAVYDSAPFAPADEKYVVERPYTIADRRVRLTFAPTAATLKMDRQFLPEIALFTGLSFTVLLGLSVHLARRARSGQTAAEFSNQKLQAENSERSRIEARLKISDERLRLALDSTQIGIFEWQVPTGQVYYSPGLWALLGYEQSHMPATVETWQALVHPDDLDLYRRRTDAQLAGTSTFIDPEYRVQARSGAWRWISMRSKSVALGLDGHPLRIIGTVQDITARREAEQALRMSQAEARKLSLVASKTDNPVIIATPTGLIEWANEAFCRVMEYSLFEVHGKNPAHFMLGPETNRRGIARIRRALASGHGVSTDVVNYSKSGRKYHLHLEIQPVRNESGVLENFIAILTDITARVESENELRRAKAEADSASRAKSEFLASMSHEIRTPMNGVIGMTSLLMETTLSSEQRDFVNTIRTSGEALLTIINDILDFSKIESGKMELEHTPFDLAICIEEVLDLFAMHASVKKLEFGYHLSREVPPWIVGDVTRLRQVLVNLINNAVKFTPKGSVFIEVHARALPPIGGEIPRVRLEFSVRDTGIGIPADRLDRLFKAFSQVDSSTTRKYGGTGLGLVICQRLTQLMGGDIRVESTPGHGSAFIFNITTEAALVTTESAYPPLPAPLVHGSVLIVETHPTAQAYLRNFFERWGARCLTAPNATAAAELVNHLPKPPALLILPAGDTDGSTQSDPLGHLSCPRLVLFPFGQVPPAAADSNSPFATVPKPPKHTTLLQTVQSLFAPAAGRGTGATGGKERPLADEFPLRVLLAEDNPVNQKVAIRFLERLGYRADAVINGSEAVDALEQRRYDLVLMDLQMPEMDGLEASRRIRLLPLESQPKIIALTANAMQGDRELCIAAGMDDYISKPVKIHEITAAIRRQFGSEVPAPTDS